MMLLLEVQLMVVVGDCQVLAPMLVLVLAPMLVLVLVLVANLPWGLLDIGSSCYCGSNYNCSTHGNNNHLHTCHL